MAEHWGAPALAIGVTSVAFLLIYFPGWVQLAAMPVATTMASVFLIGLVCGLLRHRTGSCGQP
ncbi:CPBP family glutamic-type intramembrane protease [Aminobacter sp. SS-2016]|uniref:CPBP family glutamic-type intramembrane protease n=1 Tax=Aminobacter sp. Y103A TaxID=1870862 RepID=UPI003369DC9C